ncbi:MAG: hypothetical protein KC933_19810, partial [Myxococcales bacterium]|nr:hypothetical protein [Myxococcales bacterium]
MYATTQRRARRASGPQNHPGPLAGLALAVTLAWAPAALGGPLNPEELTVVERRVANVQPSAAKHSVASGDTLFLERTVEAKPGVIRGGVTDYEGLVTGVVAPDGVVVHTRVDEVRLEPTSGGTAIHFIYLIHADPGARGGGRVKLTLSLVERRGLANVVAKQEVTHWITVGGPEPSPRDLAASFYGYRHFAKRAQVGRAVLAKAGVQVSLREDVRMPPLNRANDKVTARVFTFIQDRDRLWSAHRQLVAASKSGDAKVANAARAYLNALDAPDDGLSGLPDVALVEGAAPPPAPPPPSSTIVRLEPTASEPAGGGGSPSGGGAPLTPVGSYDSTGDSEAEPTLPSRRRTDELTPEELAATAEPPKPPTAAPKADQPPADELVEEVSDDPFSDGGARRYLRIPSYSRGLVLDDPNIAFGGAFRMAWANAKVLVPAVASAFFLDAQFALTRYLGAELTIPTQYVNVDVEGARSVFAMGKPLVALKWRLFLPDVLGRRPALTLRTRVGIPFSPLHTVPPSWVAENFTREVHFADTYAFFMEKTNVGLGASAAWQYQLFYFGAQFYTDYFIPVAGSVDPTSFFTLNYGVSFGALPFGDLVGFYAEARATSLLAGPGRTEFFTYFGARARFFEHLEPALWIAFPLGSVRNANTFQIGAEIRFSYDLYDVLNPSGG